MGVRSARVQEVIQGDDAVLRHVLVKPAVVGNNESLALVPISVGDVVRAVYATTQPTDASLPAVAPISVVGVAVVGQASTYDFTLTKTDTNKLLLGLSQTVRIEVTRVGGELETHYLYDELDIVARSWPQQSSSPISLP